MTPLEHLVNNFKLSVEKMRCEALKSPEEREARAKEIGEAKRRKTKLIILRAINKLAEGGAEPFFSQQVIKLTEPRLSQATVSKVLKAMAKQGELYAKPNGKGKVTFYSKKPFTPD